MEKWAVFKAPKNHENICNTALVLGISEEKFTGFLKPLLTSNLWTTYTCTVWSFVN